MTESLFSLVFVLYWVKNMPQLFLLHYITQCHFHFSGSKLARHMYVTNHVQITSLLMYKIICPTSPAGTMGEKREIFEFLEGFSGFLG